MPAPLNHGTINQTLTDVISALQGEAGSWITPVLQDRGGQVYNVKAYGAKGDDATDDTAAIQAAINAAAAATNGGTVFLPPGIYRHSSTFTLSAHVRLQGSDWASTLRPTAAMTNGQIQVNGNQVTIADLSLQPASSVTASNPAADGIQIAGGSVGVRILNVQGFYINGWCINFLSTCIGYDVKIANCGFRQCAKGLTADGSSASGFSPSWMVSNTFVDTVLTGDCFYFHKAHDINMSACLGSTAATNTAGHGLHIKGLCAAIQVDSCDFFLPSNLAGVYACLVENDGSDFPKLVTFGTSIFAGGDFNVGTTAGQGISWGHCLFTLARQGSFFQAGGAAGDAYVLAGCISKENNVSSGSNGEFSVQSTNPVVTVIGHQFLAGTNAISLTGGTSAGAKLRFMANNSGTTDLYTDLAGHLISAATGTPTTTNLGANVTSVTFTGNDTRGTIAIVMAGALAANTRIATCTFATTYGATAPAVQLSNQTAGAGLANVNFYRQAFSTGVSFDLACDQALAAGTYTVGYIVIG